MRLKDREPRGDTGPPDRHGHGLFEENCHVLHLHEQAVAPLGKGDEIEMPMVLPLTVLVDLITAVAVGIVLASRLFVKRMSDLLLANIKGITGTTDEPSFSDEENAALEAGGGRVILYHLSAPSASAPPRAWPVDWRPATRSTS